MIKFRGPQGPWEPVFAWRPIRDIHGRRLWLKRVFRREKNVYVWPPQGWEYGTTLDVLRDAG
jgi:hypothetical protein